MADDDQDDSSKTEDPTQRKLDESHRRGQVALSREVNMWLMLVASTIILATLATTLFTQTTLHLTHFLEQAHTLPTSPGGLGQVMLDAVSTTLIDMMPILMVLMAVALFGPMAQVGFLFAPELLSFDLSKVSPIRGLERLFSRKSILEFIKGLVKITTVSIVTYFVLRPYIDSIDHFIGMPMSLMMDETLQITIRLMIGIVMVMMIFAGLDLFYQRFDHYQRMRMTQQEVKDEYRQTEGDPTIRARLRQLRMERARQRMMQNVPKADVVITNPTHFAVALQYDPGEMMAPKVVAKGADFVAARIREMAREHSVEIVENPPLARALYDKVNIDDMIPTELYKAVAEVITYVFKKTGKVMK